MLPSPESFALYLAATVALVLTPGPDTVYVLTRGASRGRRAGVLAGLGVSAGILVHTTAAALGLAALLRTSAVAFAAIRYAGAAYLVYLGGRALLGRDEIPGAGEAAGLSGTGEGGESGGPRNAFRRGVAVNVLNPKVALFFLAFLPQFAGSGGGATVTMLLLGAVYSGVSGAYLCSVGALSGGVGGVLREDPRLGRALQGVSGAVLVGLGGLLAFEG